MSEGDALDFTSALYLGLEHASGTLPPWARLTLGKPGALELPPGAAGVERDLAALVGCERALLAPSTLHLFWDLFGILSRQGVRILLDAASYPVARWGAERAAAAGAPVLLFRRHDLDALGSLLEREPKRPPVVVADGYSPARDAAAPVAVYLECVRPHGGLVVLDDTQALGIHGASPGRGTPYGRGGGGSLQRAGVRDDRVVLISSLAKGFGAPVAMLGGSAGLIASFDRESATRTHCSPPSAAAIAAARRALVVNRRCGDALRLRLARRVARLRGHLGTLGVLAVDGLFPVQPLRLPEGIDAGALHRSLSAAGVRTVLHRGGNGVGTGISFIITARHAATDVDRAAACLAKALNRDSSRRQRGAGSDDEWRNAGHGALRVVAERAC